MPNDPNNPIDPRYYSPITPLPVPYTIPSPGPQEQFAEEQQQDQFADEQQPEQGGSKWDWIGSPSRPEAQKHDDGISDLFTVSAEDVGASDEDLSDLTDVDMDRDVIDAGEDGTLDDLVNVTEADIMGDDDFGQPPPRYNRPRMTRRRVSWSPPPTSMGGMHG